MIAYFFRFVDEQGPTGWVGFALANNVEDMKWQIDQHSNPFACEIQTVDDFTWCAFWNARRDGYCKHELGEFHPALADNDKWRKPPWVVQALERLRKETLKPEAFEYDKSALF